MWIEINIVPIYLRHIMEAHFLNPPPTPNTPLRVIITSHYQLNLCLIYIDIIILCTLVLTVIYLRSLVTVWYPERHCGYCYRKRYVEVFVSLTQIHADLWVSRHNNYNIYYISTLRNISSEVGWFLGMPLPIVDTAYT